MTHISASKFKARCLSPFGLHPQLQLLGDVINPLDEPWAAAPP